MSTEPLNEHPSTYFVQDRSNQEEMARLEMQDKMFTTGMGGVLSELPDPTQLRRVLDVGCGTGGWLIETARAYPTIEKLVGGDISNKMVTHARAQAERLELDGRVQFHTMDALRVLEFPSAFFDLVNQRLATSWIRTWEWTKLLLEYQRVTRPGGIIRITESHVGVECNSPTLMKLNNLFLETFYRSGRLFDSGCDGVTSQLAHLMTQHGIQDVQTQVHTLVYRAGTESGRYFYEDVLHTYSVALPFLQKWANVPSDYKAMCQQAFSEMRQPDFVATLTVLTAWGTRPADGRPLYMRGLR